MKVVTAPEKWMPDGGRRWITVFLAGGITGCHDWQREVIEHLRELEPIYGLKNVAVINPRREDFDLADKEATVEQIKWEHRYLKMCDLFTVFFAASDSVQPISLYEMGKHAVAKRQAVISVESGYLREEDVLIQTALDGLYCHIWQHDEAAEQHARAIAHAVRKLTDTTT